MPTSLIAPLVGSAVSTGAGLLADSLFGGGGAEDVGGNVSALTGAVTPKYKTLNTKQLASPFDAATKTLKNTSYAQKMSTPGLNISVDKKGNVVTGRTGLAQSLIDQLRAAGGDATGSINALLGQVNPGFGKLTEARVGAIDTARERTTSDLRDSLARRRIAGSSFANDSIARTEAEFGQAEAQARAESFLEELDTTAKLLDQRFKVQEDVVTKELAQTNFETEQGAKVMADVRQSMRQTQALMSEIMLAKAQTLAKGREFNADAYNRAQIAGTQGATQLAGLASDVDQGVGSTIGQLWQPAGKAIGDAAGSFFSSPDWTASIAA